MLQDIKDTVKQVLEDYGLQVTSDCGLDEDAMLTIISAAVVRASSGSAKPAPKRVRPAKPSNGKPAPEPNPVQSTLLQLTGGAKHESN